MMPTFPRPSLSFRTAGFPRYGWKAGMWGSTFPHTGRLKPAPPGIHRLMCGLCLSFAHVETTSVSRTVSGETCDRAPPWRWGSPPPQGSSLLSELCFSNRHHLIDPIRPTREHIAISPHGGLNAMPSLCGSAEATRGWFRAFADHSFLACRSL